MLVSYPIWPVLPQYVQTLTSQPNIYKSDDIRISSKHFVAQTYCAVNIARHLKSVAHIEEF